MYIPPVTFVADCPCGLEALWTSRLEPDENHVVAPKYHIRCRRCGPCDCGCRQKDTAA